MDKTGTRPGDKDMRRAREAVASAFIHGDPGEQELAVEQWLCLLRARVAKDTQTN